MQSLKTTKEKILSLFGYSTARSFKTTEEINTAIKDKLERNIDMTSFAHHFATKDFTGKLKSLRFICNQLEDGYYKKHVFYIFLEQLLNDYKMSIFDKHLLTLLYFSLRTQKKQ